MRIPKFFKLSIITTCSLLIVVMGSFLPISRAQALGNIPQWATAIGVGSLVTKEYILDTATRVLARLVYQTVITQITNKIKGGGPDGGPAFVQSWRNFQTNAQYRGEDVFRTILAHTSLCGYLKNDVNKAFRVVDTFKDIALKGQNIRIGDLDPFTLRAKCNLPEGFDLTKYQNDFAGNGGWEAFSRLNQSQGNTFGLMLASLEELDRQRNLEVSSATSEATSGGGYTSLRNACDKLAGQSRCVFLKNVKTPADLVSKGAGIILDKNLEWLTNADEISEVVTGILSSIFGYFEDLSEAPDFNSIATNSEVTLEQEKLEYCTSRKPVREVIDKYKGMFDPYGYAGDKGFGPCGDPSSRQNLDDPYPFQACVKQCLNKVGYLPTPIPVPSLPGSLPEPTDDQCTGFGASTCPGQGGPTRPNCGTTPGSLAYDLRVHHADMYTDSSGARYLWNIGPGDPNNPNTWDWLEAPPAGDIATWCGSGEIKDNWIAEHTVSSPVSAPPPYQGTRCIDGSAGVCAGGPGGGGGGGGGGNDGCGVGEVLSQPGGTMHDGVNAAIDSACSQHCSGTSVTNLMGYIDATVAWLNSNGYQARWHSDYAEKKSITVKRDGNFTEDYAIWSGSETDPQVRRAYAFTCTPGGGGGGGGGRGTCDEGAVLDDNPNGGTMNGAVSSAVGSACNQYCNGGGSQPAISNLTAYINAVVGWLNSNGYQARWHSGYGDAKNITVKRLGGSSSEDFAIWAGTDAEPRSLREAYAFRCTPASVY